MPRPLILPVTLVAMLSMSTPAWAVAQQEIGLLRSINRANHPILDTVNGFVSEPAVVIGAPMAMAFAAGYGDYQTPIVALESQLFGLVASIGVKELIKRRRPYDTFPDLRTPNGKEEGFSFPSGHATLSFAAATVIADRHPNWALPSYGLAGVISFSRLYNGVHYPTDVVAGALLGFGAAKASQYLNNVLGAWSPSASLTATGPMIGLNVGF